jgi:hypothetical protein
MSRHTHLTRPPSTPPLRTRRSGTTIEDDQSETAVLKDPLVGKLLTDIEAAGGIALSWKSQGLCHNNPETYFQKITDRLKKLSRVEYLELINFFRNIISYSHTFNINVQRTSPRRQVLYAAPPAFDDDPESDDDHFPTQRILRTPPNFQSPSRTLASFQDFQSLSRNVLNPSILHSAARRLAMIAQPFTPLPGLDQRYGM